MSWFRQTYEVALFVVREEAPALHSWETWRKVVPIVDQMLDMTNERAAIRTSQARPDHKGWLGFGRMIWNEKNNQKWCTKYFSGKYDDGLTEFCDTEIWAPDWNLFWRCRKPVDVLVKVCRGPDDSSIDQGIIIALRSEIFQRRSSDFDHLCRELSDLLPQQTSYLRTNREWAEEYYENGYSNGLSSQSAWYLAKMLVN